MAEQTKAIHGSATKIAMVFAMVGPLIGYVAVVLWDFSTGDPSSMFHNLARQPWMLLAASMYAYLFGGGPAFLTGLAAGNLLKGLGSATYVMACGLVGTLASAIIFIVAVFIDPLAMLPLLGIGGLAGLICGALTVRLRAAVPR